MAQQTAVEWLVKKLESQYIKTSGPYDVKVIIGINDIAEAKAMEKEQIIYSNYNGQSVNKKLIDIDVHQMITKAEQYYNETYTK